MKHDTRQDAYKIEEASNNLNKSNNFEYLISSTHETYVVHENSIQKKRKKDKINIFYHPSIKITHWRKQYLPTYPLRTRLAQSHFLNSFSIIVTVHLVNAAAFILREWPLTASRFSSSRCSSNTFINQPLSRLWECFLPSFPLPPLLGIVDSATRTTSRQWMSMQSAGRPASQPTVRWPWATNSPRSGVPRSAVVRTDTAAREISKINLLLVSENSLGHPYNCV